MYINITDSITADNKGSSGGLVHYLDKENRLDQQLQPEHWFNGKDNDVPSYEVRESMDSNIAKLSKVDAKFFLINISPSQKEIAHLKEQYGEDGAKERLKAYTAKIMDEYAKNFKRTGIEGNQDLLWFGKLENHRYYSFKDPEVKQGLKKRGERKDGEQLHVQVIVSRKDITNRIKLSPMNKSRGKNENHSQKMGQFDRSAFKASGEMIFDKIFQFERGLTETYRYANTQKNGSLEQRIALYAEKRKQEEAQRIRPAVKLKQATIKKTTIKQEKKIDLLVPRQDNLLKTLLEKQVNDNPLLPQKKRKKKKGKWLSPDQSQGMGL